MIDYNNHCLIYNYLLFLNKEKLDAGKKWCHDAIFPLVYTS